MIEPYKPLYTVAEASKVLKCNADLVYRFIKVELYHLSD